MLTGACMSRAGLNRKTGLATATLVLAAEASDLDVFYGIHGRVAALQHHRGWTHSFVAVPVMAGLAVLVVWAWNRLFRKQRPDPNPPVRWGVLYGIALLGPLSHILLDYTTAYGIRMFEPFSYKWYEWDIVSIIEPFMLGVLILGLVLPYLFGLINEEIGARQPQFRGRAGAHRSARGCRLDVGCARLLSSPRRLRTGHAHLPGRRTRCVSPRIRTP